MFCGFGYVCMQCSALVDNALSVNSPLFCCAMCATNFSHPGFWRMCLVGWFGCVFRSGWGNLFEVVSGFVSVYLYLNV